MKKLLCLVAACSMALPAQQIEVTVERTPGAERSGADLFRDQIVDRTKPGSNAIDLEVPGINGEPVLIHAETGKGTRPIVKSAVARIGVWYRYSYGVTNGTEHNPASQSIQGLRLNWEVQAEDETKIFAVPIGWRTPARPWLITWSTDMAPIRQGETLDGFVVDSKLAPGLLTMLVKTDVPRPSIDPHTVNTAALTGTGDKLGIEALYNVPLVLGPKFKPTPEAIQDEITFACGRPEFASINLKLKAMANQHGQSLEQSFTELQQLELTPLQRQWAAEQTQTLRLLPADR